MMSHFSCDDRKSTRQKGVPKLAPFTTLANAIHLAENNMHDDFDSVHSFEVRSNLQAATLPMSVSFQIVLEPASYTPQKFALFKEYQREIHHDTKSTSWGFKRFLVETPLQVFTFSFLVPCHSRPFFSPNLFHIRLYQGFTCQNIMDPTTSYTSLTES